EFNNLLELIGNRKQSTQTLRVKAHANWLVCYSPCHLSELLSKLADPLKSLEGFYDYAIIRLSRPIGMVRRWVKPDPRIPVPQPSDRIVLFQHPEGIPLKIDYSTIVDPEQPDEAIPTLRFLHSVNTTGGSSGGPCFDKEFELVGIHQGEWPVKIAGQTINRGIPMVKIISHYKEKLNELPLPDPADCPVWYIKKDVYKAVIGCDEFQSQVWRSAITGAHRVITIGGFPKTGKSFLVELATAILPDADHLKIVLAAASIAQKPALGIARDICSLAGAEFPAITPLASYSSTSGAWLKDEVIPKLLEALESKRQNRTVWIALTDLNLYNIEGEHASDFLLLLYGQTMRKSWLRIILDGLRTQLPSTLTGIYPHTTSMITEADIKMFMEKGLAELDVDAGQETAATSARFLHRNYRKKVAVNSPLALEELAAESMEEVMYHKTKEP
ncbi:MAG TPA: serine protease, partial [Flavisolibacter sp.]